MKIFHTSDWHFGRTLRGADLTPAFEQWADFIVRIAREENIDAVLISGDVYDRGVPPVAMVDLLSETLTRLTETTHVVLTAGNHDSPKRLGFGRTIMRSELAIRTDSRETGIPIALPNRDGNVGAVVYALPYLDPEVERRRLAPEQVENCAERKAEQNSSQLLARSHEAVIGAAMQRVRADILHGHYHAGASECRLGEVPRIAMAHAFVVGGESSESEQDIRIGGVDSVPSAVFDIRSHKSINANGRILEKSQPLVDYVALGHLHGPQQVNCEDEPLMRYSGSPIAFSFSEEHHRKSGVLLEWNPGSSTPHVALIPAPVYRPLTTIRGSFERIISGQYGEHVNSFVRAVVTDSDRPINLFARLRQHFPYLLEVQHEGEAARIHAAHIQAKRAHPIEILREFFDVNGGRALNSEEETLLVKLWEGFSAEKARESGV